MIIFMVQIHIEVICNFIASIAYLFIGMLFWKLGYRRKNLSLIILVAFSFGYMVSDGLQALSYMFVLDDYAIAVDLKLVSSIINKVTSVIFFLWIDYVQYERIRFLSLLPIFVVTVCFITTVLTTEAFRPYIYIENSTTIAVSIGKVGSAIFWDNTTALLVYLAITWYFIMQLRHAPPNLKRVTKILVIILLVILFFGATIQLISRSLPENGLALVLYSIMVILPAVPIFTFAIVVLREPQILYILGFQVFRLFIIYGESGKSIFNYRFRYQPVDEMRFSGLVQGMQQLSLDVLHVGDLREIRYEHGVLMMHRYPSFTVGLYGSRWSKYLAACVDQFARAFDDKFRSQLEKSGGSATEFDGAVSLVDKYFEFIPRDTHTIQSTNWTPRPQRVPTRK